MTRRVLRSLCVGVASLACLSVRADAADHALRAMILSDDFTPIAVQVIGIDAKQVSFLDAKTGAAGTMPLEKLIRIDAQKRGKPKEGVAGFMFIFRDGQRWSGTPGELKGDDLELKAGKGAVKLVPLKSLTSLASSKDQTPVLAATSSVDELLLANGDTASGVISASTAQTVTLATNDGSSLPIDWSNVRAVRFAASGIAADLKPAAALRVTLNDGRVIDGTSIEMKDSTLRLQADGQTMSLNASEIASIEHRGGKARMLADLSPILNSYDPYFPAGGDDAKGVAKPTVSSNADVTIAGRPVRSSILARPHSVMRWTLDGTSKTFVTRFGIPEAHAMGDVTIRVRLDDAVVFEKAHVRTAAQLGELMRILLGGAKSLTLEVDYGDTFDVQDEFYWIEPALLSD